MFTNADLLENVALHQGYGIAALADVLPQKTDDAILSQYVSDWILGKSYADGCNGITGIRTADTDAELEGYARAVSADLIAAARDAWLAPMTRDAAQILVTALCACGGYVCLHYAVDMTAADVAAHWSRMHPDQEPIRIVEKIEAQL